MVKAIILVGIGGGIGSILRYLTSVVINKYMHTIFPIATLLVNILGCLLIGFLFTWFNKTALQLDSELKLLCLTGFCGGYTTFSTFALENVKLWQMQHNIISICYIFISIIFCIFAVLLGAKLFDYLAISK